MSRNVTWEKQPGRLTGRLAVAGSGVDEWSGLRCGCCVYFIFRNAWLVDPRSISLAASSHPYTLKVAERTRSHSNSFIPRTAYLLNSLPCACFPPSYNLDCFKRNINSYIQLSVIFTLNNFSSCSHIQRVLLALLVANMHTNKNKVPLWLFHFRAVKVSKS